MIYRHFFCLLVLALTACATKAAPASLGVALPADYHQNLVQYARVDREDQTIRELFVRPETIEQIQSSRALADGTVIVIEAYHALENAEGEPLLDADGRYLKGEPLEMVHVIEKRPNWTDADFTSAARSGTWNFGSYQFDSSERFDEDLSACFNCHNATPATDFVYTYPLLLAYALTGDVQYFYCDIGGRVACSFF